MGTSFKSSYGLCLTILVRIPCADSTVDDDDGGVESPKPQCRQNPSIIPVSLYVCLMKEGGINWEPWGLPEYPTLQVRSFAPLGFAFWV